MKTEAELLRELTELTAASLREEAPARIFTSTPKSNQKAAPTPAPSPALAPSRPQNLNWALESLLKLRESSANRATTGPKVIRTRHD